MHKMTQPKLFPRDGKLWIRFSLDGKQIRKPLNLDDTKANNKMATTQIIPQMILKVHSGEFFKNSNDETNKIPLIDKYIYKSFEMNKAHRKQSTHNDCVGMYRNHIKEFFGNKRLNELKPSDIKIWQNTLLERGLSPSRVKHIRNVLTVMYRDAQEDEIIDKNPFDLVRIPKILPTEIHPFSLDDIKTILSNSNGWVKNFIALAFFTGARSGEMIGLKWEDIDFKKKEIYIKRTIKMGEISTPKTTSSIRSIDMLDSLVPFLENQYSLTGKKNSYVFLNQNDEHIYDIKRVRDTHWKKVLNLSSLEYRPIYHTRHTFATVMIENNEDILWVSNMLGHVNSTMTLSKYARYIKRADKTRASFLENVA
ncbi:MAG: tyrosine-type recombinase/integrase [Campylobacterota bacterium]|nr:tyrosine-type recombinase/integrase [Campylobacterota bacterium]